MYYKWHPVEYICILYIWHPVEYICILYIWHPVEYMCILYIWHPVEYICILYIWHPVKYICILYIWHSVEYPFFLSDFNETRTFFFKFSKNTQILNFTKIRPVGAELFHADRQTDRQTDMTKLAVAFCSFENAPKNDCYSNLPYALPPTVTLRPVHVLLCHYARRVTCRPTSSPWLNLNSAQ